MFDTLSDKLQATLGGLGRSGRLDEEAISRAMREIVPTRAADGLSDCGVPAMMTGLRMGRPTAIGSMALICMAAGPSKVFGLMPRHLQARLPLLQRQRRFTKIHDRRFTIELARHRAGDPQGQ